MRRALLAGAAAALGLALTLGGGSEGVAAEAVAQSPHGAADGCLACHAPGGSPSEPGAPLPIVETCRSCHPTADMHPVGMAPNKVAVAAGWPLEDGKVTCATCHAEPAHGGDAAALARPWHRGGPYPSVTRFCYACHVSENYEKVSPHTASKATDSRDASCAACHTGTPPAGAALAQARLRAGADKACTGTCHTEAPHAGSPEHLGRAVDPAVAAALPANMPLSDGRIACFTCHEVHGSTPPGAVDGRRSLSAGLRARALDSDWSALADAGVTWPDGADPHGMLAAPASDGSLCRACHGAGP